MNKIKKIYCRTFQTTFKLALPFLPYRKPEIVYSVKTLPEILKKKELRTRADHHGCRHQKPWTDKAPQTGTDSK